MSVQKVEDGKITMFMKRLKYVGRVAYLSTEK